MLRANVPSFAPEEEIRSCCSLYGDRMTSMSHARINSYERKQLSLAAIFQLSLALSNERSKLSCDDDVPELKRFL